MKGRMKFFNSARGYGFAISDDGGPDVFVHATAISGGDVLRDGDQVEFETVPGRNGGVAAKNVRIIEDVG